MTEYEYFVNGGDGQIEIRIIGKIINYDEYEKGIVKVADGIWVKFMDKAIIQDVKAGKKLQEVYTYNINNQLVKLTSFGVKDNKIEENTQKSLYYTYDENGNMLTEGTKKFTYNAFNQLVKAEVPNSANQMIKPATLANLQTENVVSAEEATSIQVQVNKYDASFSDKEVLIKGDIPNDAIIKVIYLEY